MKKQSIQRTSLSIVANVTHFVFFKSPGLYIMLHVLKLYSDLKIKRKK